MYPFVIESKILQFIFRAFNALNSDCSSINPDSGILATNNLLNTVDEEGQRKEQGTNTTIKINKLYKFEKEHAQAPIIPNSTGSRQLKRISNTHLGNIQKGRISRRYYRSLAIGNQNDLLKI